MSSAMSYIAGSLTVRACRLRFDADFCTANAPLGSTSQRLESESRSLMRRIAHSPRRICILSSCAFPALPRHDLRCVDFILKQQGRCGLRRSMVTA